MTTPMNAFNASALGAFIESPLGARGVPGFASVWKFSSAGVLLARYDTGGSAYAIAVDSNGDVVVGGDRVNSSCVWKLNSALSSLAWDYDTGGFIKGIAVGPSDKVYATGEVIDSGTVDAKSGWILNSSGSLVHGFIGRLIAADNHAGASNDIAVNADGDYFLSYDVGSLNPASGATRIDSDNVQQEVFANIPIYGVDIADELEEEPNNPYCYLVLWVDFGDEWLVKKYRLGFGQARNGWATDTAVDVAHDSNGGCTVACHHNGGDSVIHFVDDGDSLEIDWAASTGDDASRIALDSSDRVYLAGKRSEASSYKSVWKFNASGVLQWAADTGGHAYGIAVDGSGNVYVAGERIAA